MRSGPPESAAQHNGTKISRFVPKKFREEGSGVGHVRDVWDVGADLKLVVVRESMC
jgi:hypothetical protein